MRIKTMSVICAMLAMAVLRPGAEAAGITKNPGEALNASGAVETLFNDASTVTLPEPVLEIQKTEETPISQEEFDFYRVPDTEPEPSAEDMEKSLSDEDMGIDESLIEDAGEVTEKSLEPAGKKETWLQSIIRKARERRAAARERSAQRAAARKEAAQKKAILREAARQERAKKAAARKAALLEAAAKKAEARQEAAQAAAARKEAARQEAARKAAARREAALRAEAARKPVVDDEDDDEPVTTPAASAGRFGGDGTVKLYHQWTKETLVIQYRGSRGAYASGASAKIKHFMRCRLTGKEVDIPIKLIEVLDALQDQFGGRTLTVLSGYRSPELNGALAQQSDAVAKKSLHMRGWAADITIPGVGVSTLRAAAKKLKAGGVGTYSTFVHVDVGSVRYW